MKTNIGAFDPEAKAVEVEFSHNGVTHIRPVNACLTDKGKYDAKATTARVAEVANGVQAKIEAGVITNPLPNPVSDTPSEPA
ncbi:hypothetical protein [Asticcacaulis endophyticus]|uniref:Uncharacterized protein n=1 Tax=Asticcacaulis endophyticus TaxID=1395890 RepID=A0A918Q5U3_9CAUL|nr:hypothetical protein [Asticcacaulis endophyticus]GGZ32013.1 hypothetical protein GCM10011273_17550 [Asticcacaulis endophyticus]